MRRLLICGSNGLLGQRLALMLGGQTEYEVLNTSHHRSFVFDHRLFDYTQLDLRRASDVKSLVSSYQPDTIINAAGATNVDWCETNREDAWAINVVGVEHLAEAARKVGAALIHVSTDYIFDGKTGGYREEDKPNPVNYYGKTKLAGENAVRAAGIPFAIVRTVVLYGSGLQVKPNFALWVLASLKEGTKIRCVDDQISAPTYVSDLAYGILKIAELGKRGIFHITGSEVVSRYEFARRIAEIFTLNAGLIDRIRTSDLAQRAARPMNTTMVTLRAEAELGLRASDITQGLTLLKQELTTARKN